MKKVKINKTIGELRLELTDHTNTTPNEKRYITDGILDDRVYYPLADQYISNIPINLPVFCTKETTEIDKDKFQNKLNSDRINYAIRYLQVEALKKFIIKNYKSPLLINPFIQLYYTTYPINLNTNATKEVIQILIENYDDHYELITSLYGDKGKEHITELIYSFLPIDQDNLCSICLVSEPKNKLINCCKCVTQTHTTCLLSLHKHRPLSKCAVCLSDYKLNEPVLITNSGIVIKPEAVPPFFPYNDFYYEPGSCPNNTLKRVSGMSRLTMAIMYLQVGRVAELLKEPDVLDALPTYYFGYEAYKQTPLIALSHGNLPSNCHIRFGANRDKYIQIFNLLLNTDKIDIETVDAFDKTVWTYINQFNFVMEFGGLIRQHTYTKAMRTACLDLTMIKRAIPYYVKHGVYLYTIVYDDGKYQGMKKFKFSAGTKMYLDDLNQERLANKMGRHICSILDNINKLPDGLIKRYQIFNKLQLEFICAELAKRHILHTVCIETNRPGPLDSMTLYDILYVNYKKDESQPWFINQYWASPMHEDLELSKIKKHNNMYIKVYKGFVNLCDPKQNKDACDYKYGIYL